MTIYLTHQCISPFLITKVLCIVDKETSHSILRTIDFKKKVKMITIVLSSDFCDGNDDKYKSFVQLRNDLINQKFVLKIFPDSCNHKDILISDLHYVCHDIDCFIRRSSAVILIDPDEDDSFIVKYFWHAIAHGTFVVFYSPFTLNSLAPKGVSYRMNSIGFTPALQEALSIATAQEKMEKIFSWKNSPLTPELKRVVDYSIGNFPCKICDHVGLHKRCFFLIIEQSNACLIKCLREKNRLVSIHIYLWTIKSMD
jgi:hypothetical protein